MNSLYSDSITVRGEVRIERVFRGGGRETVIYDDNLFVFLGRKVVSRSLGFRPGNIVSRTTRPAIHIVRASGPTSAYVTVFTDANETVIRGFVDAVQAWEYRFISGVQTLATLVTAINTNANWRATLSPDAIGDTDAVTLLRTPRSNCLGTSGSYSDASTSPHAAALMCNRSWDVVVTQPDLIVDRMRIGTQGHDPVTTSLGQTVRLGDENLVSPLRAADIDGTLDYLPTGTTTFPATGQVSFRSSIGLSQGNGLSFSEVGLYTPKFMVARKTFGLLPKMNDFGLDIQWTLLF